MAALFLVCLVAGVMGTADYMLFDLQWKPTQCLKKKCPASYIGNNFNIHGMWPNDKNGGYPRYCKSQYSYDVPSSMLKDLNRYWQSYKGNSPWLWKHEWEKHGTCLAKSLSCPDYLQHTIDAYISLNAKDKLKSKNIVPGSGKFSHADIQSAFNTKVDTVCYGYKGTEYLVSLRVCYDNDWKPMDCPKGQHCKVTALVGIKYVSYICKMGNSFSNLLCNGCISAPTVESDAEAEVSGRLSHGIRRIQELPSLGSCSLSDFEYVCNQLPLPSLMSLETERLHLGTAQLLAKTTTTGSTLYTEQAAYYRIHSRMR